MDGRTDGQIDRWSSHIPEGEFNISLGASIFKRYPDITVPEEEQMDGWTDGRTDGWTDGRKDRQIEGWRKGLMDGQTDGCRIHIPECEFDISLRASIFKWYPDITISEEGR